jgi:hypothetical protein
LNLPFCSLAPSLNDLIKLGCNVVLGLGVLGLSLATSFYHLQLGDSRCLGINGLKEMLQSIQFLSVCCIWVCINLASERGCAGIRALGWVVWYLSEMLIDKSLMGHIKYNIIILILDKVCQACKYWNLCHN